MRILDLRVLGLALVLLGISCGPATTTDTSGTDTRGSSSSSSETTAASMLADLPPQGLRVRSIAAGERGLCIVREPDGALLCREQGCDAGIEPAAWTFDDDACWLAPLGAGTFDAVALPSGTALWSAVCGITGDGNVLCDPDVFSLPTDHYRELGVGFTDACALGDGGAVCNLGQQDLPAPEPYAVADATAIRGTAILTPAGIAIAINGGVDPAMEGTFADAFGTWLTWCGQESDGAWICNDATTDAVAELGPIDGLQLFTPQSSAIGCGLDAAGGARCFGDLADHGGPFTRVVVGTLAATDDLVLRHARTNFACGVHDDGTLSCWGPASPWCTDSPCETTAYCDGGECKDCGEGGCAPCGDVICTDGDSCLEPGVCRPCAAGCEACDCAPSDPNCDAELGICLCGAQCFEGECRYACGPHQVDGNLCATVGLHGDCAGVSGACMDGWCLP